MTSVYSRCVQTVFSWSLFFCSINWQRKNEMCLTYSEAVSQKLKDGFQCLTVECLPRSASCSPYRTQSSSAVPHVPTVMCVCIIEHTLYTCRSGNPSFPLFRAFFLRLQQTTVTAIMRPISSKIRKMAAAITPTEYTGRQNKMTLYKRALLYIKRLNWSLWEKLQVKCSSMLMPTNRC